MRHSDSHSRPHHRDVRLQGKLEPESSASVLLPLPRGSPPCSLTSTGSCVPEWHHQSHAWGGGNAPNPVARRIHLDRPSTGQTGQRIHPPPAGGHDPHQLCRRATKATWPAFCWRNWRRWAWTASCTRRSRAGPMSTPGCRARVLGGGCNLNGHIDTVPVCEGWETDPFTPVIKDGRMYGLGACDMKAGLACILDRCSRPSSSPGILSMGSCPSRASSTRRPTARGPRRCWRPTWPSATPLSLAEPYAGDDEHSRFRWASLERSCTTSQSKGTQPTAFDPELGINAIEEAARHPGRAGQTRDARTTRILGRATTRTLKIEGGYTCLLLSSCRTAAASRSTGCWCRARQPTRRMADMEALVASLDLSAEVEVGVKPPRYEPFLVSRDEPIDPDLPRRLPGGDGRRAGVRLQRRASPMPTSLASGASPASTWAWLGATSTSPTNTSISTGWSVCRECTPSSPPSSWTRLNSMKGWWNVTANPQDSTNSREGFGKSSGFDVISSQTDPTGPRQDALRAGLCYNIPDSDAI